MGWRRLALVVASTSSPVSRLGFRSVDLHSSDNCSRSSIGSRVGVGLHSSNVGLRLSFGKLLAVNHQLLGCALQPTAASCWIALVAWQLSLGSCRLAVAPADCHSPRVTVDLAAGSDSIQVQHRNAWIWAVWGAAGWLTCGGRLSNAQAVIEQTWHCVDCLQTGVSNPNN